VANNYKSPVHTSQVIQKGKKEGERRGEGGGGKRGVVYMASTLSRFTTVLERPLGKFKHNFAQCAIVVRSEI
jgi:hypothetical protein